MHILTTTDVLHSDGTWEGDELVRDVVHPQACLSHLKISQVSAGGMHSCALTDTGEASPCTRQQQSRRRILVLIDRTGIA